MKDRLIELIKEGNGGYDFNSLERIVEHLLSNGVIIPPCKVGDTVYGIWSCGKHGKSIAEFEVAHIDINYLPEIEISFRKKTTTGYYYFAKLCDIGKTVFFTKEEAEKALAERETDGASY